MRNTALLLGLSLLAAGCQQSEAQIAEAPVQPAAVQNAEPAAKPAKPVKKDEVPSKAKAADVAKKPSKAAPDKGAKPGAPDPETSVAVVAQEPGATGEAKPYAFAADPAGEMLSTHLSPPKQSSLGPVERVSAPQPAPTAQAELKEQRPLATMGQAAVLASQRLTSFELGVPPIAREVVDTPPLELAAEPSRPGATWQPLSALVYAPSLAVEPAPQLPMSAVNNGKPATVQDDPATDASRSVVLRPTDAGRGSLPPEPFTTPLDPFALVGSVRLLQEPPEEPIVLSPPQGVERPVLPLPPVEAAK